MLFKIISDTTNQCVIKATGKNKVDLPEMLSSFTQGMSDPTQKDFAALVALMQPVPAPNEEDGGLPKPVAGLSWSRT